MDGERFRARHVAESDVVAVQPVRVAVGGLQGWLVTFRRVRRRQRGRGAREGARRGLGLLVRQCMRCVARMGDMAWRH